MYRFIYLARISRYFFFRLCTWFKKQHLAFSLLWRDSTNSFVETLVQIHIFGAHFSIFFLQTLYVIQKATTSFRSDSKRFKKKFRRNTCTDSYIWRAFSRFCFSMKTKCPYLLKKKRNLLQIYTMRMINLNKRHLYFLKKNTNLKKSFISNHFSK